MSGSAIKRIMKELSQLRRNDSNEYLPANTTTTSHSSSCSPQNSTASTSRPKSSDATCDAECRLRICGDNFLQWKGYIRPGKGSVYEGGEFELLISIPEQYPIKPPVIRFNTKICHPNIHFKSGEICLDILSTAWSPVWTLQSCLMAISVLLETPDVGSPLNCDAGNLIREGDEAGYRSLAGMYTQLYAMGRERGG